MNILDQSTEVPRKDLDDGIGRRGLTLGTTKVAVFMSSATSLLSNIVPYPLSPSFAK
jgi:hypothetical protein